MTEREKLNKRHSEIIGKAIDNSEEVKDMYGVDDTLIHYALKYVPIKVLKKIFAEYK
jgi:hypothetical protein